MNFLKFFSLVFLVASANVHAKNIDEFKVDAEHVVQVFCDNYITFHLVKNGKKVFSLSSEESCDETRVSFDDNLYGRKVIYIPPPVGATPATASESIYIIDTTASKIILAGSLPVMAEEQSDGTFLYEAIVINSKIKEIYSFTDDNKIINRKSTMLVFEGNVCIRKSDLGVYVDSNCDGGIAASQSAPVCVERYHDLPPKIISLNECDIKKEEVSDISE